MSKAVASGMQAAQIILQRGADAVRAADEYQKDAANEFRAYLANRQFYYGCEPRWPQAPFWDSPSHAVAVMDG